MRTALWIVFAVVAVTGTVVVLLALARVLSAARQLQENVRVLGESVSAELQRLNADAADLGDAIDETHPR